MDKDNSKRNYWELEEGETIEFGHSFMRCFEQAGKLQLGSAYFDSKTGVKKYATKFTIDRAELCGSAEGVGYLRQLLDDWEEAFEASRDGD